MAFQTPITVKEAVDAAHNKKYLLPAIQRELVWDTFQIERLLKRGGSVRSKKDEVTFFEALEKRSSALEVEVARSILSWAKGKSPEVSWGSATFTSAGTREISTSDRVGHC